MRKPLSNPPTDAEILEFFKARADHPLPEINTEALEPGPYEVRLQLAPMLCWRCGQLVKAVRGYVTHRAFVALSEVSDTRTLAAFVINLRTSDPKVSPVSHRYSKTVQGRYFAAECPDCRALFGDFFMTTEFFTEKTTCEFPSCGCDNPDLQCRTFEYHGLTLTIGPDEIQTIRDQGGFD
jgi:hypothetical protein